LIAKAAALLARADEVVEEAYFRSWQILLRKSAATDWAVEPFVKGLRL
jgi:hypothetical protein